jgi:collagenase-like PrtC family protease
MAAIKFSIPYNDDPQVLEEVFKLKTLGGNVIHEIYLAGPQVYSGSGRITDEIDLNQFLTLVDKIHDQGIRVNLVFNSTCEGTNWYSTDIMNSKLDYLQLIHKEHGVEAVTIANPIYIKQVKKRLPDIEICASVLGDIDCVQRAVLFAKAGATVITPDVNINRDLELLREIKRATTLELKLMVNEGCLYKCPFRKFHFNYVSHKSKELGEVEGQCFFYNCLPVIREDNTQLLKSGWIRPEDVSKYDGISKFFKIVGRVCASAMVVRATKAYMQEAWDGDILDLMSGPINLFAVGYGGYIDNKELDASYFFKKVTSCNRKCLSCDYCPALIKKLMRLKVLTKEKYADLGPAGLQAVVDKVAEIERVSTA